MGVYKRLPDCKLFAKINLVNVIYKEISSSLVGNMDNSVPLWAFLTSSISGLFLDEEVNYPRDTQ